MKFIHAADLHIDSPLRGLEAYPGAPVERMRLATREALHNLVQLCLTEVVDFLLIAGDLFDNDVRDFNAALHVAREFQRLSRAGIPVFLIRGNHDSHEEMTRRVEWPRGVVLFDHNKAGTERLEQLGVAIHGMSYAKRHVQENLVPLYPAPVAGCFNIGVLHSNATGSVEHDPYAPCTVPELEAKGYDYWALGHIHQRAVLASDRTHVVYSGNTQGRHIRETGPKGVYLVTVTDGHVQQVEFRATDVMRWDRLEVETQPDDRLDDVFTRAEARVNEALETVEGRLLAVRIEISGRCAAHRELKSDLDRAQAQAALRSRISELSEDVWVEKIYWKTQALWNRDELKQGQDWVGELLREVDVLLADEAALHKFAECLSQIKSKTHSALGGKPEESSGQVSEIRFDDPQQLRLWLQSAEGLLLNHLTKDD